MTGAKGYKDIFMSLLTHHADWSQIGLSWFSGVLRFRS
jgi:hypothetical protein